MLSTFTFASPWALSPSCREILLRSFQSHPAGSNAEIITQENGDECITLRCTEECFIFFVNFASTFYRAELEAQCDVFDSPELRRLDGTSAMAVSSAQTNQARSDSRETKLIDHENHYNYWTPSKQDNQGRIIFHLLPTVLGKIETITSVRIKESQGRLILMGDTEEATSKAIQKLNVIEETMAYQPITHNYFALEGAFSIKLRMVSLKDVPDPRLKTTLLSPHSPYYKSLASCRIVAMVKDGIVCQVYPSARSDNATYLWQGHELSMQSSSEPMSNATAMALMTEWVDATSNAAPMMEDAFVPSNDFDISMRQRNEPPSPIPPPEKVSTKKVRKVKGATETLQPAKAPTAAATSRFQSNSVGMFTEPSELQTAISECTGAEPENRLFATGEPLRQSSADLATQEVPFRSQATQLPVVEGLTRQPPAIRGPFMPAPAEALSTIYQPPSRNWENHPVLPEDTAVPLIDTGQASTSSQFDKVQKDKKHNTMSQRKPQIVAGDTAYVTKFQKDVVDILTSVVARPGMQLHVNIGRILIDRSTISHDFRKKSFDINEWTNATNGLRTEFTGMLTSKSSDSTDILNIKLKQGRRLFVEAPVQRKVIRIVECQTKNNERITIEINDNKEFKIRSSQIMNGAINWHFVQRAWDAQLVLSSEDFIGGEYIQEIQSMVNSIKPARLPGEDGIAFSFRSKCSDFQIQSMFLRRETVHLPTMYPDLLLHLTEVQDLKVGRDKGNLDYYVGTIRPQDKMIDNHRLWWEVSISSQRVSNILKESAALELGEKAHWKPEQIIETGVVGDMYGLAQEIVTRIDHVGIENKGHVTSGSKSTTKPSSHHSPTGLSDFW